MKMKTAKNHTIWYVLNVFPARGKKKEQNSLSKANNSFLHLTSKQCKLTLCSLSFPSVPLSVELRKLTFQLTSFRARGRSRAHLKKKEKRTQWSYLNVQSKTFVQTIDPVSFLLLHPLLHPLKKNNTITRWSCRRRCRDTVFFKSL